MNHLAKKIGIIGGGQLGKMMILDAKRLGFHVVTLDPSESCPSHSVSDEHIVAEFDDESAIRELAEKTDVVTYEFEHIGVDALKKLSGEGYHIYPTPSSLEVIQDKSKQKAALLEAGLPIPRFEKVKTVEEIFDVAKTFGYPMMLKSCTGGYDGKGNALIRTQEDVIEAFQQLGEGKVALMVEAFCPFEKEISVLACRGTSGKTVIYPVAENKHVNSILDETIVPANLSKESTEKAMDLAGKVMDVFIGVGMFCVEMFVTASGEVLINEVAPRPHNSGHYTIEGCLTSQFENHIRAIVDLPLGDVDLRCPTVMKNILGEKDANGIAVSVGVEEAYQIPQVKVHIYGKEIVKPYRKMGHITAIGSTIEEAASRANEAYKIIKIISK